MLKKIVLFAVVTIMFGYAVAWVNELGEGNSSSYPDSIDTDSVKETASTKAYYYKFNDLAEAIVKVENELGVLPRGASSTVKNRLNSIATDTTTINTNLTNVQKSTISICSWNNTTSNITIQSDYVIIINTGTMINGNFTHTPKINGISEIINVTIAGGVDWTEFAIWTDSFTFKASGLTGTYEKYCWTVIARK